LLRLGIREINRAVANLAASQCIRYLLKKLVVKGRWSGLRSTGFRKIDNFPSDGLFVEIVGVFGPQGDADHFEGTTQDAHGLWIELFNRNASHQMRWTRQLAPAARSLEHRESAAARLFASMRTRCQMGVVFTPIV
jgi:hypothetical protein